MTWRATVLTIFPEMFPGPLGSSLAGNARANLVGEAVGFLRLSVEAAEVLRVSPAAIRRWLYLRRLTFVKVGTRVVIEEAELQRVIEAGRQPAWPARRSGQVRAGRGRA